MVVAPYLSRQSKVRRKGTLLPPKWVEKVKSKEDADQLFIFLINDPEREWNFGVFIVHMEGMREQLQGREFEQHKDWVFNTHPNKIPSFRELLRVALLTFIR